jgi:hypothetical protein
MTWQPGKNEIGRLLVDKELLKTIGDLELVDVLFALADEASLWDATRKAFTATLQAQGLRPSNVGGHRTVVSAALAQFTGSFPSVVKQLPRMLKIRNAIEYPEVGYVALDHETLIEDLTHAENALRACRGVLPMLTIF